MVLVIQACTVLRHAVEQILVARQDHVSILEKKAPHVHAAKMMQSIS